MTWGKTRWIKFRWIPTCATPSNSPSESKEGRRRQLQLIGKMLRNRDVDPIRQALDKLKNRHNQQVALFHKLEQIATDD